MDPAAAQFGHFTPCLPWNIYKMSQVQRETKCPTGYARDIHFKKLASSGDFDRLNKLYTEHASWYLDGLKAWEHESGITVGDLLKLAPGAFESKAEKLMAFVIAFATNAQQNSEYA